MIQVSIKKDGKITNQATFSTQAEVNTWLSTHEEQGNFGQKAQTIEEMIAVTPEVLDASMGLILPSEYKLKVTKIPGYEVEIIDTTIQDTIDKNNKEALAYLDSTDWVVLRAAEHGEQVSAEFRAERDLARAKVVK
jgi:hypothetical protein